MNDLCCREETSLTTQEKRLLAGHLEREEISDNIWDLFEQWVARSTSGVGFVYLKAYRDDDLLGLGLFLKVKPVDLRSSYARLRNNKFLNILFSAISTLGNDCAYISLRNLITANITRPFFYRAPETEGMTMRAILNHLKREREADMSILIDTSVNDRHYRMAGFSSYPCPSEAWLDATKYGDISEYLDEHRNLKKNLKRWKGAVVTTIESGPMSDTARRQMKDCIDCSIGNSKVNVPGQRFFEENIFESEVFNSDKYVHILSRIDERIVGFHTFQVSGSNMGGVLGGFDRDHSQKNFVYERVILASLDYAIENKLKRVNYSLIDNYTKMRLVDSREPCGLYFHSRNPVKRKVFDLSFRFSDIYELHRLERRGLSGS